MSKTVKFREYAEECQRIAQQLPPAQKATLLEIAKAWMQCAELEERKNKERKSDGRRNETE